MKIKATHQPAVLQNALLLVVVMALLLLGGYLTRKQDVFLLNSNIQPSSASSFLTHPSTLAEVLEHYREGYTIFFSVKDDASLRLPPAMRELLASIGGDTLAQLELRYSYAGIYRNGKIIKEVSSEAEAVSLTIGKATVESAGNGSGNFSKLSLHVIKHSADTRGLNLYVVDSANHLVGTWCFDFFASEMPVSTALSRLSSELATIVINLERKYYNTLKKKRDEAVIAQVLLNSDNDLVPANIQFNGNLYAVKMRLKGDWVDHLQGDQWSFRMKMEGVETLMGMRKFSLHRPATRNYAGEWLFHQVLADAGILNLQYHFVAVALNIQDTDSSEVKILGVYALEEGFDKQLIERNQRRESVILKLDESLLWEEHEAYLEGQMAISDMQFLDFHKYREMNIVPFGEKRIWENSTLYRQFLTGSSLFRAYIDGEKKLSEVFDVALTAKFTALAHLLGANHALAGHNYRVYYNPVTSKLEPIGFDGNAGKQVYGFIEFYNSRKDIAFQEAYVRAVEEITANEYIQKIAAWPGLSEMIELMQTIDPQYEWTEKMLIHNQRMLQGSIRPKQSLRINYNGVEKGSFRVAIENFGQYPVEILDLSYQGNKVFGKPLERTILPAKSRTTVSFKLDVDYEKVFTKKGKQKVGFHPPSDIDKVIVVYNTLGSKIMQQEKVLLWQSDRNGVIATDPFQRPPNAGNFDFLLIDERAKTITCKPGEWRLEENLIIPAGYTFIAGPGVRLNILSQFTAIYSYSPLRFIGTPGNPVEIFSHTNMGLGMLVLNTADTSLLRYCKFTGLSNPSSPGWSVTGAVNFYEADVKLEHCVFNQNRCEDALNILRAHFTMTNCVFTNSQADAFDGDFVTGTIKDCIFNHIGNDAIDVSGSSIRIEKVAIDQAGDKGISAGEDSEITARQIVIKNSEIALASKDNSVFTITRAFLENNKLGFTAFQKKPEFGPAKITADSVDLKNCGYIYLIEKGSSLLLNGQKAETVSEVKDKMYGVEFGKSSR